MTYHAREATIDSNSISLLHSNVAADGSVVSINVLSVLFECVQSTVDVDVRSGRAVSSLFDDLHVDKTGLAEAKV